MNVEENVDCVVWFNCLGEDNLKDNRLGNSFLKNDGIRLLFDQDVGKCLYRVKLFGRTYNRDCPLLEDNIFHWCLKKYLSIYHNASRMNKRIYDPGDNEFKNKNYSHLRKEICELMNYICSFLANPWNEESFWLCNTKTLNSLHNQLSSFWAHVKKLSDLSEFTFYSGSVMDNECTHASFHLVHLSLDLLWYRLCILFRLEQLVKLDELQGVSYDVHEEMKQYIQLIFEDLFSLAISRFEKLSPKEIKKKSPFRCTCVKEMWLLIQLFVDKHNNTSHQNEFWSLLNTLCTRLLHSSSNVVQKNGVFNNLTCTNPVLFSFWILFHLGQLYMYGERGEYMGSSSSRMVSNYTLLDELLKFLLSVDIVSEAQLRSCIPFITDIVIDLWPPKRDPVCKLWEHFHHRLNGCFFLPGASTDTIAIPCSSGAEMLLLVQNIMDLPTNSGLQQRNSFYLFLRLLGVFLSKNPSQRPNIEGRIFSKFSQTKMQSLKEMGIFNFGILCLCMALSGHAKEVGDKMQYLLNWCNPQSVDLCRHLMIWRAQLALLQLYIEKEMDITEASALFMEDVNHVSRSRSNDSVSLFNLLARGLKDITTTSKNLDYSEHILIGSWISSYMRMTADPALLIDTLLEIMKKILTLSKNVGMIEYDAPNTHLSKMYLALCKHLLPYIKEKFANSDTNFPSCQVADLAVKMTLLALNRTNVGVAGTSVPHLFESFTVNAHPLNSDLSIKYVCVLLQEEGILSELMDTYINYEVLIIQTWIRSSVYVFEENSQHKLSKLTNIVWQMPSFRALCQEASIDIKGLAKPGDMFILGLGRVFLKKVTLEERTQFREQCLLYLTPVVKSFERLLRNKGVNQNILCRIYEVASLLILHCGTIIYSKSQPYCIFNSLINSLLLPVALFKPGAEMPSSMLYAVRRTFPVFVKGIVKLNGASGNSLISTIKNLVVRYFPRLVGKVSVTSQECKSEAPLGHSLLLCFDDSDKDVSECVLEIISQTFLKVGDPQCVNTLMFLLELLQAKNFNKKIVEMFIDMSLARILEIIILSDSSMLSARRQAVHLLNEILLNKINDSPCLRQSFWSVLWALIERHMVLHSVNIMSLLSKICKVSPIMIIDGLPQIKDMIKSPELFHRSNVAKNVRFGVENIEKLLSLSKQNEQS
ncbi:hypothetical protein R5R35_007660 [Gryllus longicercus]|uniref:Protein MMS22-like n=1 Tax=Gryllus longicercus TaxID=2509291 RepID=A0AAN9VFY7_9ORTH